MFTGIVEERGTVLLAGSRLLVRAQKVGVDSGPGASVAVNGVCLTVVDRNPGDDGATQLAFDLSPETLARSALGRLRAGDPVNLERPVTLLSRLGGHLVQGHVDAVGEVSEVREANTGSVVRVRIPEELLRYVVAKGSVSVDGVSLTVTDVERDEFGVALVPFTLAATTLGGATRGDVVNVEVDMVAKYVEGFLRRPIEERGEGRT
jgi:riboflavin synthase